MFFKKKKTRRGTQLREMIGDYDLPSFSATAVTSLSLLRSDAGMSEIAERLLANPGLNVRILRTVNCSAFGLRCKVTNLEHAANLLGRSRLESLVLTAAVGDSLPSPPGIDATGFWRTSARRACLARHLARTLHPSQETEVFTAALLQDMAVPILAEANPEEYPGLYQSAMLDVATPLVEFERSAFGFDHAEIGARIAESWELPEPLIAAIADHHASDGHAPLAVEAVSQIRHTDPADTLEVFCDYCIERFELTFDALDQIVVAADSESASLAQAMDSAAASPSPRRPSACH